ncbi:MAG: hypothetical protein V4604_01030 [Bacteroidota bacterium]
MKTLCSLVLLLLIAGYSSAQKPLEENYVGAHHSRSSSPEATFEAYCLTHALTTIEIPEGKTSQYVIAGEVKPAFKAAASYADYGIELKEEETQYFQISGTNTILKAESLYRLRLSYALSQQKL